MTTLTRAPKWYLTLLGSGWSADNLGSESSNTVAARISAREKAIHERMTSIREFSQLPPNWDRYGGNPADPVAIEFAINLLNQILPVLEIPAPEVRPISSGVFVEWKCGDTQICFEIDDESVLCCLSNELGEEATEDTEFDFRKAAESVKRFYHNKT